MESAVLKGCKYFKNLKSSCLLVSNLLKIFKIYFYNINHKNSVLLCSLMKIIKKIFNNIHFPMDVNPIIIFIFLINKYFHIFRMISNFFSFLNNV